MRVYEIRTRKATYCYVAANSKTEAKAEYLKVTGENNVSCVIAHGKVNANSNEVCINL